jgi:hypothetical protein
LEKGSLIGFDETELLWDRSRLVFCGLHKRYGQEQSTCLINNLDHKVLLLFGRQIFPVRNHLHEDLCYSQCSSTGSLYVRQGKVLGIPDTVVLITDEKVVRRHDGRNISQGCSAINLLIGVTSMRLEGNCPAIVLSFS